MFYDEPRVELVGRPQIDVNRMLAFLDEHDFEWGPFREYSESVMAAISFGDEPCCRDMSHDAEWLMEAAGRLCYLSYDGKKTREHDDYIKHIIEVQHGSVCEHVNFNFVIWGVSRSLTHELVRHRSGAAYSQLSQRYVDETDTDFVVPPDIQKLEDHDHVLWSRWIEHCEKSRELYADLTDVLSEMHADLPSKLERRKKARQAARSVLPNATETKIFVTLNGRSIRHIIEMRAHISADLEIRKLAVAMFKIISKEFPLITHGMRIVTLEDDTEGVESEYRKV